MTDYTPDEGTPSLAKQAAASLLRSWLNAGAGMIAAKGIITQDQGAQLATLGVAVGLWLFNYGWSLRQKRDAARRLKAAIAAPAGQAS